MKFKCTCCKSYHEMTKKYAEGFSGWAYSCMEWSDFSEDVPDLSERHWERSDITPKVGELRTVRVENPFDDEIESTFYAGFEPANVLFNGYRSAADLSDTAIVKCRFEKVLAQDEFCAWIVVKVLEVMRLTELVEKYPVFETGEELGAFGGVCRCSDVLLNDSPWEVVNFDMEGDVCETKIIYTDTNGVRHLVYTHYYDFFDNYIWFGNIVEK